MTTDLDRAAREAVETEMPRFGDDFHTPERCAEREVRRFKEGAAFERKRMMEMLREAFDLGQTASANAYWHRGSSAEVLWEAFLTDKRLSESSEHNLETEGTGSRTKD